ncbi:hypothetical protein BFP75_20655 [Maribacter sp. 4G9]|nr:hypothetical protein BFP75_20655 [Maribacter sp. 4G9]
MNVIKTALLYLLSLISLLLFYYILGFLYILFERLSNFWIVLITILGGGLIGFITVGYIQLLNKLIPANRILNGIFILFALGFGLLNVMVHWQIDIGLIPRICYILIFAGSCFMIIKSRIIIP